MASKASQVPSSLENLPSEIRRHILSMVDIDSLKTLVQASPVYFHQYRRDRKLLLCQSLESTLGSVTADAYAVHKSSSMEFSTKCTTEEVDDFLPFYHTIRSQAWSSPLYKVLSMEEVTSMVKFHRLTVQPLMQFFVTQALSNLIKETKGSQIEETLSSTEETRLMRAFYRYQLCCNIYGPGMGVEMHHETWNPIFDRISKDFLCIFCPWEAEEISCISFFSKTKHTQFLENVNRGVDEEKPQFDFDLNHTDNHNGVIKTPISRCLEMLHFICFKIKDRGHLVTRTQDSTIWFLGNFLVDSHYAFNRRSKWHQHCDQPGERDHGQRCLEPITFQGDKQPNGCCTLPPLAWTMECGGTDSDIFWMYLPSAFRQWGWVMWDAARFKRMGAEKVMIQQWNEGYPFNPEHYHF
ncbi:hypothetical protein PITC_068640 [Penicillium italicum]|uniref:F-box domain-containing protein n=1 Tax=Penicillium italicum TaxID=40296 RepID=A0A0A2LGS0_PENIT|nr:hypothetical protein PITC_068640 [Penicillium italicum]